jgi:hypothetical protein
MQFTLPQDVRKFVLGGNAVFTIESVGTGTRFTYKVRASDTREVFFVSLLSGSDNEADYTYLGTIFASDPLTYRHGRKSRVGADAGSVKAFEWLWRQVSAGRLPATVGVWHEGRCGRCGRTLTVPSSIESGFGPECITHV